jgi:nitric oxide reductase NorD protein
MQVLPKRIIDLQINFIASAPSIGEEFNIFITNHEQFLTDQEIIDFVNLCNHISESSLRAWEATSAYLKIASTLFTKYDFQTLMNVGKIADKLCQDSPIIAACFLLESLRILHFISIKELEKFYSIIKELSHSGWKEIALTNTLIIKSSNLLQYIKLEDLKTVVVFSKLLSEKSHEFAMNNLENLSDALVDIPEYSRKKYLDFINTLALVSWPDVGNALGEVAPILKNQKSKTINILLNIVIEVLHLEGRKSYEIFVASLNNFLNINDKFQYWVASSAKKISKHNPASALDFIETIPNLINDFSRDDLSLWLNEGINITANRLKDNEDNAYFKLESAFSLNILYNSSSIELLERKKSILQKYCRGLSGVDISIIDSEDLIYKKIGWDSDDLISTDGYRIYLPKIVNIFNFKKDNFNAYKVYATHQSARIEFGSFTYKFKFTKVIKKSDTSNKKLITDSEFPTEIQKFFSLFENKALISLLFSITEDYRIDCITMKKYPGLNHSYKMMKDYELSQRLNVDRMPLIEMIIEYVIRFTLGKKYNLNRQHPLSVYYLKIILLLESLSSNKSSISDSADVAFQLYTIIDNISTLSFKKSNNKLDINKDLSDTAQLFPSLNSDNDGNNDKNALPSVLPKFRGDFKPDLVEFIVKIKKNQDIKNEGGSSIDPELLAQFLKNTNEINIGELTDGEFEDFSNLFANNLSEYLEENNQKSNAIKRVKNLSKDTLINSPVANHNNMSFLYHEWNFRSKDYKPDWCRVIEKDADIGDFDYYEKVLSDHASLIKETKKKFEFLKPEALKKERRLEDGDDIDLDRLVDFFADKLAGYTPEVDFYSKRNKSKRDVSVALLLDMSASTDEIIEGNINAVTDYNQYSGDPSTYFRWLASRDSSKNVNSFKRIIDIEKESTIVLSEALESIGDSYGLFGFSGYGKDNVEFFIIKDIDEPINDEVKKKIAGIQPVRSTRMGPAIRHTINKLDSMNSKVKIMILISDGRPQDHEYGKERTEKEYAIRDTRQALLEAKHKGIVPFLITVDKDGNDYLKDMCSDIGYEIVSDIDSLPERLANLYRNISVK